MICCIELVLNTERCNKISCDNTVLRTVLRGFLCRILEVQARLFHGQTSDSPTWCYLSKALEEGLNEGVLQRLFHWAEGVPIFSDLYFQQLRKENDMKIKYVYMEEYNVLLYHLKNMKEDVQKT